MNYLFDDFRNADLVSIHSQDENDFIFNNQPNKDVVRGWMTGLTKTLDCKLICTNITKILLNGDKKVGV